MANISYPSPPTPFHSYSVDIDLKKAEEKDTDRKALKKALRKVLEERYLDQSGAASKSERKSQGSAYFYKRLRF